MKNYYLKKNILKMIYHMLKGVDLKNMNEIKITINLNELRGGYGGVAPVLMN
jgi:hypothetical protein